MKRKLVLWGTNEKDEKLLVALELLEKENVVNIYTFPEAIATESLYKEMSEKWTEDQEIDFPKGFSTIERKLSASDSLLPDEIKVDRPDKISRAQLEWHFVVLSSKLYNMYRTELDEIKEKIDAITEYDNILWDELRTFWDKVQAQVTDKNLYREHGAALREKTNGLFDKLKSLKKNLEKEFESQSKNFADKFREELQEIEDKIDKGLGLSPLFEDLKKVQAKVRDFKFTKSDREAIWNKIDDAFKKLKAKRGQGDSRQNSGDLARVEARYTGLIAAIQKMQRSVDFDQKDFDYETKKEANSGGQLESQLRQAKINMIAERLKSKQEKLADMHKTKTELESKIEREKKKVQKQENQLKVEEAKEIVKQKIASDIEENAKEMDKISEKLEKAASELTHNQAAKPSFLNKLTESVEQLVEDVIDSAKAVAEVAEDKIEDAMEKAEDIFDNLSENISEKAKEFKEAVSDKVEELTKKDKPTDSEEDKNTQIKDDVN